MKKKRVGNFKEYDEPLKLEPVDPDEDDKLLADLKNEDDWPDPSVEEITDRLSGKYTQEQIIKKYNLEGAVNIPGSKKPKKKKPKIGKGLDKPTLPVKKDLKERRNWFHPFPSEDIYNSWKGDWGYTRIPNAFLEKLFRNAKTKKHPNGLTQSEQNILLYICRESMGYGERLVGTHPKMKYKTFCKSCKRATGLSRNTVYIGLKSLEQKGWIRRENNIRTGKYRNFTYTQFFIMNVYKAKFPNDKEDRPLYCEDLT